MAGIRGVVVIFIAAYEVAEVCLVAVAVLIERDTLVGTLTVTPAEDGAPASAAVALELDVHLGVLVGNIRCGVSIIAGSTCALDILQRGVLVGILDVNDNGSILHGIDVLRHVDVVEAPPEVVFAVIAVTKLDDQRLLIQHSREVHDDRKVGHLCLILEGERGKDVAAVIADISEYARGAEVVAVPYRGMNHVVLTAP